MSSAAGNRTRGYRKGSLAETCFAHTRQARPVRFERPYCQVTACDRASNFSPSSASICEASPRALIRHPECLTYLPGVLIFFLLICAMP
jgi:hypothetical protein